MKIVYMPINEIQKNDLETVDFSLADREKLAIKNPRIKKLYNYFSKVCNSAYHDHFLLSNTVFAKSDLLLSKLDCYLNNKKPKSISFIFYLKKIFHYFIKSFGWLVVCSLQNMAHGLSLQKFLFDPKKSLTLIDIHLTPEQIVENGDLNDRFFPGLEARLQSKGLSYAYVPKFTGAEHPFLYYKMFRNMKKMKRSVLSNFQLLRLCDYFNMFVFIFSYPLRVLRQIYQLEESSEDKLLRFLLWDTMAHTAVKNYARQIFGKRISELNIPAIKCISWYENQPQDKNFYKGLRSIPGKVCIYGAQLYLWPSTLLNIHVDENEIEFESVPDLVLVNGTYYLRDESLVNFKLGPSMRYAGLFNTKVNARTKTALLVLMPFFEYEINEMLEMIDEAELSVKIFVKFHPAINKNKYIQKLEGKMQIVDDDIYSLFQRVGCVIGKSTGALVEATSLGIPVINIESHNRLSHEYLPKFGKGVIWQNAKSGAEIVKWLRVFRGLLNTKAELINNIAQKHKEMFFCEPTGKMIDEAFDLGNFTNR